MVGRLSLRILFTVLPASGLQPAEPDGGRDPAAPPSDPAAVYRTRDARTGRVSSWDRSGGNRDFISFAPGERKELLALDGPGAITHVYMTPAASPAVLRSAVLRMFWDGETSPSVEVPLGDFFCAGECNPRLFASHFVVVNHGSGTIAYNAYFPMPFRKSARVTLENGGKEPIDMFWYHIEYELYDRDLPADAACFHAHWRRENPTRARKEGPGAVPADMVNRTIWDGINRTGDDNYVILEAEGRGHVVGLFLTCHNLAGGWWGEGDDMIFIDDEPWPPRLHGTGTEDYFNSAFCPKQEFCAPYHGLTVYSGNEAWPWGGKNSMYRFHIEDPIRFERSIRVTIESGHNNALANDYSSTAYWYQRGRTQALPALPPVEARIPRPDAAGLQGT